MEDKIFRVAVLLSLIVHALLFGRIYSQRKEIERLKKDPEFSYKIERSVKKPPVVEESAVSIQQIAQIAPANPLVDRMPQNIPQELPLFKKREPDVDSFKMYERQPERHKGARITKEVNIPILKSEKIDTPTYVSYYEIVRSRIRERAYINFTKLSGGEVYITFVIRSNGAIGEMQIIENRSVANDFLREIGQKSVREAGPFPPFPKELDYPELTFNIAISFQYREE